MSSHLLITTGLKRNERNDGKFALSLNRKELGQRKQDMYAVLSEGCQECGVRTLFLGLLESREAAVELARVTDKEEGGWRDVGHSDVKMYDTETKTEIYWDE